VRAEGSIACLLRGTCSHSLRGLWYRQALSLTNVIDDIDLVPWVVELLVERDQIVDQSYRRLDMGNRGCHLIEEFLLVELPSGKKASCTNTAETIQASQEMRDLA
jgi:hypothetical protein